VIQADRDKIVLALHNLIGNALKYTDAGGRVSVSVSESAGRLAVSVSDTGVGISEADAERVFDKFYRAKDGRVASVTGTGLGLTLARDVVRLHGGDIELESELNKGTRFTIVLPSPGRMAA
jgi:two-component system sensor histidine kinase VicK